MNEDLYHSPSLLKKGERLDNLQRAGLFLIQDPSKFCFGMDAVLLCGFCHIGKGEKAADLGCGNGIIPILLSGRTEAESLTGLEIQDEMADMARRSVMYNGIGDRVKIVTGDLRRASELLGRSVFDVVTSNPPYLENGKGPVNPDSTQALARHEILCTFADVAREAALLLKPGGRFYLVHRPYRLAEILAELEKNRLGIKKMRFVHPAAGSEAGLVLVEAVRGAKTYVRVEKPLIIFDAPGQYSEEIRTLYGF